MIPGVWDLSPGISDFSGCAEEIFKSEFHLKGCLSEKGGDPTPLLSVLVLVLEQDPF